MDFPPDWTEVESIEGGINAQTVRSFAPKENDKVRIELFYRGLPINQKAANSFRQILKSAPLLLFEKDKEDPAASRIALIEDLEEALGNIGNNQIVNKETGIQGPPFEMLRLESLIWNTKPLLAAHGYFKNPEENQRVSEFCGFFIDADPNDSLCKIEEIYLQTPNESLYIKYLPIFQKCLHSIEWL